MSILSTVKKGTWSIKTVSGYIKYLPRTLATLVDMSDGKTVEETINTINTNLSTKAPTSHASTSTTYGVGTTSNYGHVKTINNLTTSSYANGQALSAYQGYLLNTSLSNKSNSDHTHDSRYYTETEINTKLTSLITTAFFTASSTSIAYATAKTVSFSVAKSGYKLLGVVSYSAGWAGIMVSGIGINVDSNNVQLTIYNTVNSTITCTPTVTCLYVQS